MGLQEHSQAAFTESTSGLAAGQVVVLADLSQPIPASNSTARLSGFGGAGGFGGGGTGGFTGRG